MQLDGVLSWLGSDVRCKGDERFSPGVQQRSAQASRRRPALTTGRRALPASEADAMVTNAPSISADGSPGASRCCSVPSVAAATGTPSCAADSTAKVRG